MKDTETKKERKTVAMGLDEAASFDAPRAHGASTPEAVENMLAGGERREETKEDEEFDAMVDQMLEIGEAGDKKVKDAALQAMREIHKANEAIEAARKALYEAAKKNHMKSAAGISDNIIAMGEIDNESYRRFMQTIKYLEDSQEALEPNHLRNMIYGYSEENGPAMKLISNIDELETDSYYCYTSQKTEEGYNAITHEYEYDEGANTIQVLVTDSGKDCDGPMSTQTELYGTIDETGDISWSKNRPELDYFDAPAP